MPLTSHGVDGNPGTGSPRGRSAEVELVRIRSARAEEDTTRTRTSRGVAGDPGEAERSQRSHVLHAQSMSGLPPEIHRRRSQT